MKMKIYFFFIFVDYLLHTIDFIYACSVGVIDAGSTGTRLNIFQIKNNEINTVSVIKQKGGIDTIPFNSIGIYLNNLIKNANFPTNVPLIFNSTAGMRKLNKVNSNKILDKIKKEMWEYNLIENKVIKGEVEAYYTLKSIEYAAPEMKEFIIIDMGGKSVQIIEKNENGHSVKSYEIGILDNECLLAQDNIINEINVKRHENNRIDIIKRSYNELIKKYKNDQITNKQVELKKENLKSIINSTFQNLFDIKKTNQNYLITHNNYNKLELNNNTNSNGICNEASNGIHIDTNPLEINNDTNQSNSNINVQYNSLNNNENCCNLKNNTCVSNLNLPGMNNNEKCCNFKNNTCVSNLYLPGINNNEKCCNFRNNTCFSNLYLPGMNNNTCSTNLNTLGINNNKGIINILNSSKRCNLDPLSNFLKYSIEDNKQDINRGCVINVYNLPNVNSIFNFNVYNNNNNNQSKYKKQTSFNNALNNNIELRNIEQPVFNSVTNNNIKQNMLEKLQKVILAKYCKCNINNYNKIKPLENIEKNKSVFLLSIFNDLFGSENEDKTLETIEYEYKNACYNQFTKTCKEKNFLISFLKKLGFEQKQRFKIVRYLNKIDITWSYGKAIDFCENNSL